ncbi:hypothetical protein N9L92_01090 [Saprospiraceae bacterium]|nr:hypothetical protein [Saprospiraceae bacterium]
MKQLTIAIIGLFLVISCKNDKSTTVGDKATTTETAMTKEKTKATKTKYSLSPFSKSPGYTDAKISDMVYKGGKFTFDVTGTDYKLGMQTPDAGAKMCANSAKGQHIHLIVDNEPYAAKYTSNFDYDIKNGEHTLMAFLSRSYHESIKTPQAHIFKKITVDNKGITKAMDITEPMVTYSRPKGTYVGKDTKKVMLDFYVSNAELGKDGYKLDANINGESHNIDKWQPYYLEGLPMGENKITLSLMKGDKLINKVTRMFELKEEVEMKK